MNVWMKIGQETTLLTKINRRFIELSISQQKTAICTAEYSTYIEIEEEKKNHIHRLRTSFYCCLGFRVSSAVYFLRAWPPITYPTLHSNEVMGVGVGSIPRSWFFKLVLKFQNPIILWCPSTEDNCYICAVCYFFFQFTIFLYINIYLNTCIFYIYNYIFSLFRFQTNNWRRFVYMHEISIG